MPLGEILTGSFHTATRSGFAPFFGSEFSSLDKPQSLLGIIPGGQGGQSVEAVVPANPSSKIVLPGISDDKSIEVEASSNGDCHFRLSVST